MVKQRRAIIVNNAELYKSAIDNLEKAVRYNPPPRCVGDRRRDFARIVPNNLDLIRLGWYL